MNQGLSTAPLRWHAALAIEVDTSLPARRVVAVLDKVVWPYGLPQSLASTMAPSSSPLSSRSGPMLTV